MSAGRIQLLLKGVEDRYVTGSPQITYFRSVFNVFNPFEIRYNENQFYSYGVAFGGSQLCLIKNYGDIVRSNFLKIILPSLFVNTYGWCYPRESRAFNPDIFLIDENFNVVTGYSVKDTVTYYNTAQRSWMPYKISYNEEKNKFEFNFTSAYIGFRSLDDAVFWGFRNYDIDISYTVFNNSYYVFKYRPDSEIQLDDAGWVNSFFKYFRRYKKSVGSLFIENAELYIGGQLIENLSGEYMSIIKDVQYPEQVQDSLDVLEGASAPPSTSESKYYVHLPFSMQNIPICALQRHPLEIKINFKKFTDIVEPEFLNMDQQFSVVGSVPFVSNVTLYDGQSAYFINEERINNAVMSEPIIPKSAVRAYTNIYVLTNTSNIIQYNTESNVQQKFNYLNAYTVKTPVGTYVSKTFVNISKNGIAQMITGSKISEFDLGIRNVYKAYYFNTLIFAFTNDGMLYIFTEDFKLKQTYKAPEILRVHTTNDKIYFIGRYFVYSYDTGFSTLAATPGANLTASTVLSSSLCLFYDSNSYFVNTSSGIVTKQDLGVNFKVTESVSYLNGNQQALFLSGREPKIYYKLDIYQTGYSSTALLSNSIVNARVSGDVGVWVSNASTVYYAKLSSSTFSPDELYLSGLTQNTFITFDNNTTAYIVDDANKIFTINTNKIIGRIIPTGLLNMSPKTLAYDGSFVYAFPNNGTSNVILFDVQQKFTDPNSYLVTQFINPNSETGAELKMYATSSNFDGTYVYAVPDSRDANILSYNTRTKNYNVIDYMTTAQSFDYTPQDLTNTIIAGKTMYMFWSNGFYRYDTSASYKPYETYTNQFDGISNIPIAIVEDPVNSNVYVFESNFGARGFTTFKTSTAAMNKNTYYPYNRLTGNLYSSFVEYNSDLYFVPRVGNTFVRVTKTDPLNWTAVFSPFPQNGSNASILINDTLYAFPGPSSSNTCAINLTTRTAKIIHTPVANYQSATWDGSKYVYLTSPNVFTRFNTTLDVFNDYTGYRETSSNAYITPSDFIAQDQENIYFLNSTGVLQYNAISNAYNVFSEFFPANENIVGVERRVDPVLTALTDKGTLIRNTDRIDIGNRNDVAGLKPIDVATQQGRQCIFVSFSNTIGRLDTSQGADIQGTGYYNPVQVNRPMYGNALSSFVNNTYIYTTYNTANITRFNMLTSTYERANITSTNIFSKTFVHFSNVYLLPSNGNTLAVYNFNNAFTTSNIITTNNFVLSNISTASNTLSYIYFASKTSNVLVQYDPVLKQSTTFTTASFGTITASNVYGSNVIFFPYNSNVIVSYLSTTQNFTNLNDALSDVKVASPNVISVYNGTCLTDKLNIFKLSEDDTSGSDSKFAGAYMYTRKGYIAFYTIGVTNTVFSSDVKYDPSMFRIITDLYFDEIGEWIIGDESQPLSERPRYNIASLGAVKKNQAFNTSGGSNFYYIRPSGGTGRDGIFYVPENTDVFGNNVPETYRSNILPKISNGGFMTTTDASYLMNTNTYAVSGQNIITDARYSLYANITVAMSSTTRTFAETNSNSISFDVIHESIDDVVALTTKDLNVVENPQKYPPINIPSASWSGTAPTFTYTVSGQEYGNGTYTITSSPLAISTYNATHLFDGIDTGGPISYYYTSTPNFIQIQMPDPIILKSYILFPLSSIYATPTGWRILASNDGNYWTTIDTRTNSSFKNMSSSGLTINLPTNSVAYSYYRMQMDLPTLGYLYIKQWKLYGRSGSGGKVSLRSSRIGPSSMSFSVVADRVTGFVPNLTVRVNNALVPLVSTINFSPNSPVPTTFNFTNIYSTQNFTYIFGENTSYTYGNLIAYKNNTTYALPISSFPLRTYEIGNIDTMIKQGPVIYMITNGFTQLWRFNEQYDGTSYPNIRFTNVLNDNLSGASMFNLSDGIGILTPTKFFGIGITDTYTQAVTDNYVNPVVIGDYVYMFRVDGVEFYRANITKISEIARVNLYNLVSIASPSPFVFAYYDSSKYLIVILKGKILTYTVNPWDGTGNPVTVKTIPWDARNAGVITPYTSFIASSNTNDVVMSYVNSQQRTYRIYRHRGEPIYSNIIQFYGDVAYMLPTSGSNIVAFNMRTTETSLIPIPRTNPVYYRPPGLVLYNSNTTATNFDGRYVSLSTESNIIQYDTFTNSQLTQQGYKGIDTAVNYLSNIYFMSRDQVVQFSFAERSYKTVPVPDECNGLQHVGATVYMSSASNIYALTEDMSQLKTIARHSFGAPRKSLYYQSNLVSFSYEARDALLTLSTDTETVSTSTVPKFNDMIWDDKNLYLAGDKYLTRVSSPSKLDTNSEFVFYPRFTLLGKGFSYGGNTFLTTDASTFLVYNSNSSPFISSNMISRQEVLTTHFDAPYIYYPPSNGTSNIVMRYDTRLPFFKGTSYSNLYTGPDDRDYRTKVRFDDTTYFVPFTKSNLITYNALSTNYPIDYRDTTCAAFSRNAVFYANVLQVSKLFTEPLPKPYDFSTKVLFTRPQNIKNLTFDGRYIYTIGDFSYKIDSFTLSDYQDVIADTDPNIFTRDRYASAYFDGRYINLVTNTITAYDTIPLTYPLVFSPSVITEYAYISDEERKFLQNRQLQYVVKQVQSSKIPQNESGYYKIDFLNLLSEVVAVPESGKIDTMAMYLNGHEKFSCDGDYLSRIQLHNYHSRRPTRSNVYAYSFCTNPEDEFPDGHLNASRIIDKVFYIKTSEKSNVNVYGVTHNVCKIKDGLGGLVFNTRTS